jgi:hypothetical protein
MRVCKYWDDTAKCQYCSTTNTEQDLIIWRSAHNVVSYLLYRLAISIALTVGFFVGLILGIKL